MARAAGARRSGDPARPYGSHVEQRMAGVDSSQIIDAAFRRAGIGMAITDPAGNYLEVNDALCAFMDRTATSLLALSFIDLTAPDDRADGVAALARLTSGADTQFAIDKRYVTATGLEVWARTTGIAVHHNDGTLLRVIVQVEDLTERRAVDAALLRRNSYDELTDLANRRFFYECLQAELDRPRRATRSVGLLVVNLDRFHQVNAGLGHAAGDRILREAGERIVAVVRGDDTVARLDGDEFAVLAPGLRTPLDAVSLAVEIRHRLGKPYWSDGNPVYVSARVGVVTSVDGTIGDGASLVEMACSAAHQAKSLAGGWSLHAEGADVSRRDELGLVSDLREAIDDGTLTVAYQPVVDGAGFVQHLEVLARWNHRERGAIPPDQFIVLAEQNELIAPLTTKVMTIAANQAAAWRAEGIRASIAVNLSGRLLGDEWLVEKVGDILQTAELPADAMTLEITETALADGGDVEIRAALERLRATGIRISIDDFGTGYSSLSYLRQLPVDELKIDRSFVVDLDTDDRTERIVRSIIDLAHSLGLSVVAEGVEDESIGTHLLALGVDHLQGYGIARPASAMAITEWLRGRLPATPGSRAGRAKPRGLDVLVVDGDPSSRVALDERLRANGHHVVKASTGAAALEKLANRMPDVVILGQLLPGMSGVETVPRLREAGYAGPILLFSTSPPDGAPTARYPLDVWPVSADDDALLIELIDGYAVAAASDAEVTTGDGEISSTNR